jgi:outer membrane lipoprotein SlyB
VESPKSGAGNSEGQIGTIAAGTSLALAAGQQVCTNTNHVGDRFTATLSDPVTASNGAVLPAGATAVLEVMGLKQSQRAGDNMSIELVVRSISYAGKSYPVNGEITSAQTQKVRAADNHDAAKVLGGAAIGGILGRIFSGRSKTAGTVIGAAGGAAAGAVVASQTAKYDACIPSGGRIMVRLDQAMQIQTAGSAGGGGSI